MIDSSFDLECNVETLRKFRSRGVKTITKCSHYKCSMKKRMRLSKRKSSDTTDESFTDIESVKERRELVKSVKSCKAMYLKKDESEVLGPSSEDIHEKTPRLIRLVKFTDESEKRKEVIKV